jgi:hypothetical protein
MQSRSIPIRYLGIPIHFQRLINAEWKIIEEKLLLYLSSWKGKLLSIGGRLVLINSVLSNMKLYMLSFFLFPKGVLNRLELFLSRFYGRAIARKKYRLAKWSFVCSPKDQGGLGIQDLEVKNTALLGKWLFRLFTKDGIWQTILKQKYAGSKALSQVL